MASSEGGKRHSEGVSVDVIDESRKEILLIETSARNCVFHTA